MNINNEKLKEMWDFYQESYGPLAGEIKFRIICIKHHQDISEGYGDVESLVNLLSVQNIKEQVIGIQTKTFGEIMKEPIVFENDPIQVILLILEAYRFLYNLKHE